MVHVKFRYIDKYSRHEWSYHEGDYESLNQCIEFNGLEDDPDCYDYEILEVKEI